MSEACAHCRQMIALAHRQFVEALERFKAEPTLQRYLAMDAYANQYIKELESAEYERQVREMRAAHPEWYAPSPEPGVWKL